MNIERFCIELTGLHDNPQAAKKITVLILATWLLMLGVMYIFISSVDSLGNLFVDIQNDEHRQLPMNYANYSEYQS